jgi:deoxycytidine triphosphate deaminase
VIFLKADKVCTTSYKDKGGKYQKQTELTIARV